MFFVFLPVLFYLSVALGIVWIVKKLGRSSGRDEITDAGYLERAVSEIAGKLSVQPDITAAGLLDYFRGRLAAVRGTASTAPLPAVSTVPAVQVPSVPSGMSFSNWYRDQSINILLYIGAFLIVITATIIVAFQWGTLSGTAKSLLLSLGTVGFLVSGSWLFSKPRTSQAGVVFTAVGTVLIHFSGMAWHSFVLMPSGISFGPVWLITSVVTLATSVLLIRLTGSRIFAYLLAYGTVSFMFALVYTGELADEFYIPVTHLAALILTIVRSRISSLSDRNNRLLAPLSYASSVMVPASLVYGLFTVALRGDWYTVPTSVGILTAIIYYAYLYISLATPAYLSAVEGLIPLFLLTALGTYHLSNTGLTLVFTALILTYAGMVWEFAARGRTMDAEATGIIALFIGTLVLLLANIGSVGPWYLFAVSMATATAAFVTSATLAKLWYVLAGSFALLSAIPRLSGALFPGYGTGMLSGFMAFVCFVFFNVRSVSLPDGDKRTAPSLASSALFALAGLIFFGHDMVMYFMGTVLITLGIMLVAFRRGDSRIAAAGYVSWYWSANTALQAFGIPREYQQYLLFANAVLMYGFTYLVPGFALYLRNTSYLFMAVAVFRFWHTIFGVYTVIPDVVGGLMGISRTLGLVLSGLYAYEFTRTRYRHLPYAAVIAFTAALTWQLKLAGVTDSLAYCILWGSVLAGMGYALRNRDKRPVLSAFAELVGSFLLLVPSFINSFGADGYRWAIAMGLVGLAYIAYGNTASRREFVYAGSVALISAVVSRSYSYIAGLEKWMITGILGLGFLVLALYLLFRRQDKS